MSHGIYDIATRYYASVTEFELDTAHPDMVIRVRRASTLAENNTDPQGELWWYLSRGRRGRVSEHREVWDCLAMDWVWDRSLHFTPEGFYGRAGLTVVNALALAEDLAQKVPR